MPPSVSIPFSPTQGSLREPSHSGPLSGLVFLVDGQRGTVVAEEEDEGVLGESVLVELCTNAADAIIHGGDHRQRNTASARHLTGEAAEETIGGVQRHVRGEVGEVEKERVLGAAVDEGQGGLGLQVEAVALFGDISRGLQVLAVAGEVGPIAVGVAAVDVVESPGIRQVGAEELPGDVHYPVLAGLGPGQVLPDPVAMRVTWLHVPLADHSGAVSSPLQPLRDEHLVEWHRDGGVVIDAEAGLIAPGKQAGARGDALGRAHVAAGAAQTIGSQAVEMGCFEVIELALTARVRVALVVGENDDDVRALGGGGRGKCQRGKKADEATEEELKGNHVCGGTKQRYEKGWLYFSGFSVVHPARVSSKEAESMHESRSPGLRNRSPHPGALWCKREKRSSIKP